MKAAVEDLNPFYLPNKNTNIILCCVKYNSVTQKNPAPLSFLHMTPDLKITDLWL